MPTTIQIDRAEAVKKAVCKEYDITIKEMNSMFRTDRVAYPRNIAMLLCVELFEWSNPFTDTIFNKKYGAVYHACKTVKGVIQVHARERHRIIALKLSLEYLSNKIKS